MGWNRLGITRDRDSLVDFVATFVSVSIYSDREVQLPCTRSALSASSASSIREFVSTIIPFISLTGKRGK